MSFAFLKTMRENPQQSYINVLQNTRQLLEDKYSQIPQLSVGAQYDLNQMVSVSKQAQHMRLGRTPCDGTCANKRCSFDPPPRVERRSSTMAHDQATQLNPP